MATGEQLKALLKSHAVGDDDLFRSVVLQIAATEATKGNGRLAQELRDLIEKSKRVQQSAGHPRAVPIARPTGDLAGLVLASYPSMRLSDMVLAESTREQIEEVISQQRQRDLLRSHGLSPKRKLLLVGPPGCGKTMTASVIASECQLPLLFVQLHSLITKYMGETAAKLHMVFDAMCQTRGVYLFDEFDAIGATRDSGNDVGEMRRVLNSFLQFLERDGSESIIVAATNFVGMLDDALFRRFDDVIAYDLPDKSLVRKLIANRLSAFDLVGMKWADICLAARGLSHAEVARACDDAARGAIMSGQALVSNENLARALKNRNRMRPSREKRKQSE
ncbi:ATPase [Sorangium cellulosum]|uniref:ATPase n=1 Tax=Sorangium cellulosum TaxID=56 RepID=A0A150PSB3_SORCE|nr:ATPase [Sorangium cellulosum]